MATPKFNKARGLWVLQGQKNGIKKTFYSSIPGQRGKRDVLDKYDEWIDGHGRSERITVSQVVELYLRDIEARKGKGETYKQAEQYCRLYIVPALGKAKMNNLTLRDWQNVINEAKPHTERVNALSNKTLTTMRAVIVNLHRFAYNNYYCEEWRGSLYIPQGHQKGEREILQPKDIARLFEPSELWYYPCFLVMLLCGLRPSEALGIKTSDLSGNCLIIRRGITDSGRISSGKTTNARRVIPLPPLAEQIIKDTIARNEGYNFDTEWVFCGMSGEQASQNTMRKHWNRLKRDRCLPGTPYSLRHTYISIVSSQTHLAEGTIRELVGHSKTGFDTFGTYKHQVDGEIANAAEVINLTFERLKAENT